MNGSKRFLEHVCMFGLSFQEVAILGVIAVLLFGKRLPEVARSFGASYRQFREGLHDLQRQMDVTDTRPTSRLAYQSSPTKDDDNDDYDEPTAPKFELPTGDQTS
jgi:sec-independent protein translocase protein TatA